VQISWEAVRWWRVRRREWRRERARRVSIGEIGGKGRGFTGRLGGLHKGREERGEEVDQKKSGWWI